MIIVGLYQHLELVAPKARQNTISRPLFEFPREYIIHNITRHPESDARRKNVDPCIKTQEKA